MNEPIVTQTRKLFSRSCLVRVHIRATPEHVWELLVDTREIPHWTTTISEIEGEIRKGQRLVLHVPDAPGSRTFTVTELKAPERMVWTGRLGPLVTTVRTIALRARPHGSIDLAVEERVSGLGLPMVGRGLPDLEPRVRRYATDLKFAAEHAPSRSGSGTGIG